MGANKVCHESVLVLCVCASWFCDRKQKAALDGDVVCNGFRVALWPPS